MIHFFWRLLQQIINPTCSLKGREMGLNIKLQKNVTIDKGCYIYTASIGKYTYINKNCIIEKSVESIGKYCSIAYGCKIGLGTHPINRVSTHAFSFDKKYKFTSETSFEIATTAPKCIIGNDVWIGANAIILAGVTIGDGAIIGANSFVNKDIEPYSIVTGTPAKHQKFRFEEKLIAQIQKIKWWDWNETKIKENILLFQNPEDLISNNY